MTCVYELTLICKCPANDSKDCYNVTVTSDHMIRVEELQTVMEGYNDGRAMWQEEITVALASKLQCKVTTVGYHHGVRTTVTSG